MLQGAPSDWLSDPITILLTRWIFGSAVCNLWNSIDVHASTVSTLHLCAISFDRFYAIVKPFDYDHFMNTYSAMGMITAAWLCPAAISFVPIFLGWYTTQHHLEVTSNLLSLPSLRGLCIRSGPRQETSTACLSRTFHMLLSPRPSPSGSR